MANIHNTFGEFEMDWDGFFKDCIVPIMNTETNSLLTQEIKDEWARIAVTINADKL